MDEQKIHDREVKETASRSRGFNSFMESPMTKLALSMLPAADNQDVLPNLLRAAFDAGAANGQGSVIGSMLEGMFEDRKDRRSL